MNENDATRATRQTYDEALVELRVAQAYLQGIEDRSRHGVLTKIWGDKKVAAAKAAYKAAQEAWIKEAVEANLIRV